MSSADRGAAQRRHHWEGLYTRADMTEVSWYQPVPTVSVQLIETLAVPCDAAVLDVGGGTSTLVDELLARGFTDLTVLDVSESALDIARERVGGGASVRWEAADVLAWSPGRRYDLWHDRAVFHFLTRTAEQNDYVTVLRAALRPGGQVIVGTFAADGPDHCSGLPVARYGPEALAAALNGGFDVLHVRREEHTTPAGRVQPFTWIAAQRAV